MSPTSTSPKRSLAIGSAFAVAVALGLSACGEYSPMAPEKEKAPPAQRDNDSRDDADPTDPYAPQAPEAIPDAAPPAAPPGADTQRPGSGGNTTPRSRQGGRSGSSGGGYAGSGGSGSTGGSGGNGGSGSNGGSSGNGGQPEPRVYAWGLPLSDTSPNDFQDGPAYAALLANDCDRAASFLDAGNLSNNGVGAFRMKTPRYVLLLSAGIAMCRSAFDEARASYSDALSRWGTQGLDNPDHPRVDDDNFVTPPWRRGYREPECDLYRSLTYSLTGVAADSLQCPGGLRPVHRYVKYKTVILVESVTTPGESVELEEDVVLWDDPRTSEDETAVPPKDWNGTPGQAGTSFQRGPTLAGDPDDEFDFPEPPPIGEFVVSELATVQTAAESTAPSSVEPAAAEARETAPGAVAPATAASTDHAITGPGPADGPTPTPAEPADQTAPVASVPPASPAQPAPAAEPEPAAPAEPAPPAHSAPPAQPAPPVEPAGSAEPAAMEPAAPPAENEPAPPAAP
ncbi:hypothetical protein [Microbacterium hibisci]|uniref:hypothetical protein n=1 Tax=Microbacterium hibisci TaxID=2036000 RepID=UPI001940878A|nr:hypothetical protein [Microbacterium hibisci]